MLHNLGIWQLNGLRHFWSKLILYCRVSIIEINVCYYGVAFVELLQLLHSTSGIPLCT